MHFEICRCVLPSAVIRVGYTLADVTVLESDGEATLTVVTMPTGADPIEIFFSLLLNTLDGTATSLPWTLEFNYAPIHSVTNRSLTPVNIMLTHAHTNSYSVHM